MTRKTRIAILQTGRNNPNLRPDQPDYPALFRRLLGRADKKGQLDMIAVPVLENIFPASVEDFDGYLLTGSAAAVYEDHDWLAPLQDFVQQAFDRGKPLVGICFGHQLLAKALGGQVEKSSKGWGYGIRQTPWTDTGADRPALMPAGLGQPDQPWLRLIYSHQDQVTAMPPGARLLSGDDFCPYAAYQIGDRLLSIQGHPEFIPDYADNLYQVMAERVGPPIAAAARQTLSQPHDGDLVGEWILAVLLGAGQDRGPS